MLIIIISNIYIICHICLSSLHILCHTLLYLFYYFTSEWPIHLLQFIQLHFQSYYLYILYTHLISSNIILILSSHSPFPNYFSILILFLPHNSSIHNISNPYFSFLFNESIHYYINIYKHYIQILIFIYSSYISSSLYSPMDLIFLSSPLLYYYLIANILIYDVLHHPLKLPNYSISHKFLIFLIIPTISSYINFY